LEGVELKLDPPLEVTGLVIGKSGKPVPGARVALVAAEEKDGVMPGRDLTLSDAQGRFAFKGMGAGTYTLDVTVRGDEVAVKTKPFGVSDKKRSSDQKVKVPTD
jgi:protocatechuate 3,4-dioxygenase beta subunit